MNNKKNFFSALVYQSAHIIYGFVVPRIILSKFGSELNGLVSSVTQFLSFISLLEGGLAAVVLAELYTPIERRNSNRIREVLCYCQIYFKKLAMIFVIYAICLAAIYANKLKKSFDYSFTYSLVMILSLTTLAQYLFSITLKLYLQAEQKIYITNTINAITLIINTIIAYTVSKVFPEIRLLLLLSSVAFFIQPLIYRRYIPKEYWFYRNNSKGSLKDRWSGFAQNLAYFITMNTDIALITIFCTFSDVSIYSVYIIGLNSVRSILISLSNSYQSALGKYFARNDKYILKMHFNRFCILTWALCLTLYCTCMQVVNTFVRIYTSNVNDAEYYQPFFALIMLLANMIYCLREPYRLLVLAAGKFRETNIGSIIEAILNLTISLALIKPMGLIGVAIGTIIAVSYRALYLISYTNRDLLAINIGEYFRYILTGIGIIACNIFLYFVFKPNNISWWSFIAYGIVIFLMESITVSMLFVGLTEIREVFVSFFKRTKV